jgi:hypothetical protein
MQKSSSLFLPMILALTFSCGTDNGNKKSVSKSDLKLRITQLEDSMTEIQKDPKNLSKITSLMNIDLINRLTAYYRAFPADKYSSDCLFKIHMKYSELNAHEKSVAYGDTLLKLFPNYENKEFLLESMASAHDAYILPRDTAKVRYYFNQLLADKTVSQSKKQDICNRLKYLNLSFEDYILKVNNLRQ